MRVTAKEVEALERRRKALNLTRQALAERIGVTATTLYRWEAKKSQPVSALLKLWRAALNGGSQ